jgi:hypothetical protein
MAMRGCHNNNNKKLSEVIFIVGACDFPAPRKTKDENEKDERRTSKHGGIWYVLMWDDVAGEVYIYVFIVLFWILGSAAVELSAQAPLSVSAGLWLWALALAVRPYLAHAHHVELTSHVDSLGSWSLL